MRSARSVAGLEPVGWSRWLAHAVRCEREMSAVLAATVTLVGMSADEIDTLFAEIARYLALVDLLRHEEYEPRWLAETLRR